MEHISQQLTTSGIFIYKLLLTGWKQQECDKTCNKYIPMMSVWEICM